MRPFHVYLLRCSDGSYYCGHTDNIDTRMQQHYDSADGYTSTRKPVVLVWQGEFETRWGAMEFEQQVKGWSRAKKEALIAGNWEEMRDLAKSRTPVSSSFHSASRTPHSVPPEFVEGASGVAQAGLRQAQPERGGVGEPERDGSVVLLPALARSGALQPVSIGSGALQPVSIGSGALQPVSIESGALQTVSIESGALQTVRPELVEGAFGVAQAGLRQAQPERGGESRPERGGVGEAPMSLASFVLGGDLAVQRRSMAKAITLLESTRADHRLLADAMLTDLLPHTGRAFRLGLSGVPGVGKSTFIEVLGLYLIGLGHRVAVLTIDPSSTVSGGSILGDKTRMEKLSVHERAFIRPSPSGGTLGGVAEKTREAMLVCEAAGYDIVIVETVGVGQSEIAVAGMTDMFVLMQLPNAGDELQAIKKGVMEMADLVVINKADIDAAASTRAQAQIASSLRLLGQHGKPASALHKDGSWHPQVLPLSALLGQGVDTFWSAVCDFRGLQEGSGALQGRRRRQSLAWMWERIETGLRQAFRDDPQVHARLVSLSDEVAQGAVVASVAARELLALFARQEGRA